MLFDELVASQSKPVAWALKGADNDGSVGSQESPKVKATHQVTWNQCLQPALLQFT